MLICKKKSNVTVVQLNRIKLNSAKKYTLVFSCNFLTRLTYNVVLDKLLIAQEDLLPIQDGGLRPGEKGSGARVHSSRHLFLGGFGYTGDHHVGSLQWRK